MSSILISVLAGLGGMFGWGMYDFLAGVYSRTIGPYRTFFWSQTAGLLFLVLIAATSLTTVKISFPTILLLPVAAIFYSAGYLFFMKGFKIGNMSLVAAIMNLWAVFTMAIAFLFMGQRLTSLQFMGVVMIIFGAIVASINWDDIRKKTFQLSVGVKEAVLGSFFFGSFWNMSEIISEEIGWLQTTLFIKIGIILFLLLLSLSAGREIGVAKSLPKTKLVIIFMGIIEVSAVALVNFGLTVGDAILITPIASALSVVTIAMAIIFLKDRVSRVQGIGILTSVSGIIVTGV